MQSEQHDSWKSRGKHKGRERLFRDARRFAVVVALSALLLCFVGFLTQPFLEPQTHMVLLGTGKSQTLSVPLIGYVDEDLRLFEEMDYGRVHDSRGRFQSAKQASRLGDDLLATGATSEDTLVIYLTAHGVSLDGKAYVLCENFDLRRPDLGRLPLEMVIKQIRKSPAKTKLLLFNSGNIDYDPRLGMVVNEFPRLLSQAVRETGDPTLWVLCSHDLTQTSHGSRAAKNSVFGMFSAHGLRGAADLDGDHSIGVVELAKFASGNVAAWVEQSTAGHATQTPRLYWGGGKVSSASDPHLLSIHDRNPNSLSVASLIADEDSERSPKNVIQLSEQSRGILQRHQVTLASAHPPSPSDASAESATEKPDGNTGDPKVSVKPKDDQKDVIARARQLLRSAWDVRDRSSNKWSPSDPINDPIENVPHLWSEFEAELLHYEQMLGSGNPDDASAVVSVLNPTFGVQARKDNSIESQLFRVAKKTDQLARFSNLQVHSIALADFLASLGGKPPEIDRKTLDAAIDASDRKPLDEWLKKNWKDNLYRYSELSVLKSLSDRPNIQWKTIQIAVNTCFRSERIAAHDFWLPGWIRDEVGVGDQQRFYAQQLLIEQSGTDWQNRAIKLLAAANQAYDNAEKVFLDVRNAQRLRDSVLEKLPSYLQSLRVSHGVSSSLATTPGELEKLIDRLTTLSKAFSSPGKKSLRVIRQTAPEIAAIENGIDGVIDDRNVAKAVTQPLAPGQSYWLESVLGLPLLNAPSRAKLSNIVDKVDVALAKDYVLPDLQTIQATELNPNAFGMTRENRNALLHQARLVAKYAALIELPETSKERIRFVREQFEHLERLCHTKPSSSASGQVRASSFDRNDAFWNSYAAFGNAVYELLSTVSLTITPDAARENDLSLAAAQSLRVLDPRDAWRLRSIDVASLRNEARLVSTLDWQSIRSEQSELFSSAVQSKWFADAANDYRRQSLFIDPESTSRDEMRVSLVGPSKVDLQYSRAETITVRLVNPTDSPRIVAVTCDYKENLFHVTAETEHNPVSSDTGFQFCSKRSPYRTRVSRPISIPAGGEYQWSMTVARRDHATTSSQLTLDAFDVTDKESPTTSQEPLRLAPNQLLARKSVALLLPVAEVVVVDGNRSTLSNETGLRLTPYPNRINDFKIGVINQSSVAKAVSLKAFAVDSRCEINAETKLDELIGDQTPLMELQLATLAGDAPTFPAAKPAPKKKPGAESKSEEKEAGDSKNADPQRAAKRELEAMLFVLEDIQSGQSTLRKLSFAVQRPRRFVVPKVGFNAQKGRIEIEVRATRADSLPAGPPVIVNCRLRGKNAAATQGKLQDILTRNKLTASMFVNVPAGSLQTEEVLIDVDGYPRAFRFDVQCGKHASDISEVNDRVDVQMRAASDRRYLSATNELPLVMKIDAPAGTFENGEDNVEFGLDLDQTGTINDETLVRLDSDRQVVVEFIKAHANGNVQLIPEVSDHFVNLNVERIENVPLNVKGRLTVQSVSKAIPGLSFFIDTSSPLVGPLQQESRDPIAVGAMLNLSAIAWDTGSGVRNLEAVVVPLGVIKFPEKGSIVQATQSSSRKWTFQIPAGTKPGPQTVLVRGIDRVGNISDPISVDIDVLSPTSGVGSKTQSVQITGVVTFGGEAIPQANIELKPVGKDPDGKDPPRKATSTKARKAVSTKDGRYGFSGIAPGKYQVVARAVIRNRVRMVDRTFEVKAGLERKLKFDVQLR